MSDPIKHFRVLHNNPFIFASAFVAFFKELGEKERGFLLSYFVLPMTLYHPSHQFLKNATSRSSLRTMLQNPTRIHGLDERVSRYRHMTNITMQYLIGGETISIQPQLIIDVRDQKIENISPEGVITASRRLGIFFHPYDVPTVFRMLGVMYL